LGKSPANLFALFPSPASLFPGPGNAMFSPPMSLGQNGATAAFFPGMFQFANQDVGPKSAKTESDLGGDGRSPSSTNEVGNGAENCFN
jgi:hypothetical protein